MVCCEPSIGSPISRLSVLLLGVIAEMTELGLLAMLFTAEPIVINCSPSSIGHFGCAFLELSESLEDKLSEVAAYEQVKRFEIKMWALS